MIKCCNCCVPTCQHCIYAEKELIEIDGWTYLGEIKKCKLRPNEKVSGAHYCKDFHCLKAKEEGKNQ